MTMLQSCGFGSEVRKKIGSRSLFLEKSLIRLQFGYYHDRNKSSYREFQKVADPDPKKKVRSGSEVEKLKSREKKFRSGSDLKKLGSRSLVWRRI